MAIPQYHNLSTDRLGSVFKSTTATYKFYWFNSILDLFVLKGKTTMSIWEIIAEMSEMSVLPIVAKSRDNLRDSHLRSVL